MKQLTAVGLCPACGPVPTWATSNYCSAHTAELWQSYLALRLTKRVVVAVRAA